MLDRRAHLGQWTSTNPGPCSRDGPFQFSDLRASVHTEPKTPGSLQRATRAVPLDRRPAFLPPSHASRQSGIGGRSAASSDRPLAFLDPVPLNPACRTPPPACGSAFPPAALITPSCPSPHCHCPGRQLSATSKVYGLLKRGRLTGDKQQYGLQILMPSPSLTPSPSRPLQ
jgi:hypothetical protein